jgi:Ca2+-binding RTX toxin-like protein
MGKAIRRTPVLVGAALGALLWQTGPVLAASPAISSTTLVVKSNTTVTVTAAVGLSNTISVRQSGGSVLVSDSGDSVAAFGGCTQVSPSEASCPAADLTELVVNAGDQNDEVRSSLNTPGVTLVGGTGDDALYAGSANDTLEGNEGNDFLSGGTGNDTLTGGSGQDQVSGGSGNDSIDGNSEDDLIDGGTGNDVISGGNGNDRLYARAGNDYVAGDNGNDTIYAQDGVFGNDFVDGGAGTDSCSADPGDNVTNCP